MLNFWGKAPAEDDTRQKLILQKLQSLLWAAQSDPCWQRELWTYAVWEMDIQGGRGGFGRFLKGAALFHGQTAER